MISPLPLVLVVLGYSASSYGGWIHRRVISGQQVQDSAYPWAVSLKGVNPTTKSLTFCGATILSSGWLLTAAHCFNANNLQSSHLLDPKNWHVQAGSNVIECLISVVKKESSVNPRHAFVTQADLEYDIALLKLKEPFPLETASMKPAQLPPSTNVNVWPPERSLCTFIGWGCVENNKGPSAQANVVALEVLPNDVCSFIYDHGAGLNKDHEFCAGYYKSEGDSGNGLIYVQDKLPYVVGVASATHAEEPESFPGLFTRVAYFAKWINTTMNDNI